MKYASFAASNRKYRFEDIPGPSYRVAHAGWPAGWLVGWPAASNASGTAKCGKNAYPHPQSPPPHTPAGAKNTYPQPESGAPRGGAKGTKTRPTSCIFRIRRIPNPREKDLVLVDLTLPVANKLVLMSVRAYLCACICLAPAHRRAFAPSALMATSYSELMRAFGALPESRVEADADRHRPRGPLHVRYLRGFGVKANCLDAKGRSEL